MLLRHRRLVAVEAVDDDRLRAPCSRRSARTRCENSPGVSSAASTCSMTSLPASPMRLQVDAERLGPRRTAGRAPRRTRTAPPARRARPRRRRRCSASSDLPVPAGPRISMLEPRSTPPPSSAFELRACRSAARRALEAGPVLGRDQPRKDLHAAGLDDEVVVAAAERLAAILDDPQPPPLGAVVGRQLLQPDHAVRDAVHGLVGRLGGQVVEHQHGRVVPGEIVLQRQDLAAVAQRALRQQADLRQAVEHDPVRLHAARPPRRSAWSSRRARGRTNRAGSAAGPRRAGFPAAPARRSRSPSSVQPCEARAGAQLVLGLGQGDVERRARRPPRRPSGTAARSSSCRCPGLPSSRKHRAAREPAAQDVVQPGDAGLFQHRLPAPASFLAIKPSASPLTAFALSAASPACPLANVLLRGKIRRTTAIV